MVITIRHAISLREHDSLTSSIRKRETWHIVGREVCFCQSSYSTGIWLCGCVTVAAKAEPGRSRQR